MIRYRRAESVGRVLGEGQLVPFPPARWSGERCNLPGGVWGGAAAEIEFGAFLTKNLASDDCK